MLSSDKTYRQYFFYLVRRFSFFRYMLVGFFAIMADWLIYFYGVYHLNLSYQLALVVGFSIGGLVSHIVNRFFTFHRFSRRLPGKFRLRLIVALIALAFNLVIIAILISFYHLDKISARILTSMIMGAPHYFLHKYVTFNAKFFRARLNSPSEKAD